MKEHVSIRLNWMVEKDGEGTHQLLMRTRFEWDDQWLLQLLVSNLTQLLVQSICLFRFRV